MKTLEITLLNRKSRFLLSLLVFYIALGAIISEVILEIEIRAMIKEWAKTHLPSFVYNMI